MPIASKKTKQAAPRPRTTSQCLTWLRTIMRVIVILLAALVAVMIALMVFGCAIYLLASEFVREEKSKARYTQPSSEAAALC